MAIASRHVQIYGESQTDWGVFPTLDEADALTGFRSIDFKETGGMGISRPNVNALGGEAAAVQGSRYWEISGSTELNKPLTAGDLTSWQHYMLWRSSCSVVDDGSTITVSPTASQSGLMPIYFSRVYRNGQRVNSSDSLVAPTKISGQGGGVVMVEWTGAGTFTVPTLESTLGAAPAPVDSGTPIACTGMQCLVNGSNRSDLYSWSLSTGISVHAREDMTKTFGYGSPVVAHDGAGELTMTVVWDDDFHMMQYLNTVVGVSLQVGGSVGINCSGRIVSVNAVDVVGALGAEVVVRLATGTSMPWGIVFA